VWETRAGYRRINEFASGGVGPHDIKRIAGTEVLVVANGGIDTHPETGRTKLNIPTMAPNLSYIDNGEVIEIAEPPRAMHKNSIRHLALAPNGAVAFGMQWQGDGAAPNLVGLHRRGAPLEFMQASPAQTRAMQGYVGSIAVSGDGVQIAVTSPRGGIVQSYDINTAQLNATQTLDDVCGVAQTQNGFAITTGTGLLQNETTQRRAAQLKWDNHLINV
ncbi:DUF1513 domain-containing protein, partial [Planktotalea sp.]|uniref:DUF1513 domain-containing protein n=1 Tax=Planktotalea sp. TaxID=2029877 RepID=UPI003297EFE7